MQTIINIYQNISLIRKNTPKKIQTTSVQSTNVQSTSNVKTGVYSLTSIIGIATTSLVI